MDWSKVKFFKPIEFACNCPLHKGQPVEDMDEKVIIGLERLREILKVPLIITSGWRCEKHNQEIGGQRYSFHILKKAVDFKILTPHQKKIEESLYDIFKHSSMPVVRYIWSLCEKIGFPGLGYYYDGDFFHVDSGDRFARWIKKDGKYINIFE